MITSATASAFDFSALILSASAVAVLTAAACTQNIKSSQEFCIEHLQLVITFVTDSAFALSALILSAPDLAVVAYTQNIIRSV